MKRPRAQAGRDVAGTRGCGYQVASLQGGDGLRVKGEGKDTRPVRGTEHTHTCFHSSSVYEC